MTKAQRKARAKRAGAVRRKANAVKAFMRKMNPGKKAPVAVRVKRLKGGGISVTPLKVNAGPGSLRKSKKRIKKEGYSESTWWDVQRQAEMKRRKRRGFSGFRAWEPKKFKRKRRNIAW